MNHLSSPIGGQRKPGGLHQRSGGGGAIFFVSNDLTGSLRIDRSEMNNDPGLGFETDPGIFLLAREIEYISSMIE